MTGSRRLLTVALAVAAASASAVEEEATRRECVVASVYAEPGQDLKIREGVADLSAAARIEYCDTVNTTGWAIVRLWSSGDFDDATQAAAAGFAEGSVTALRIYQTYVNNAAARLPNSELPASLNRWFTEQRKWVVEQCKKHKGDPYWDAVWTAQQLFEGLVQGYNAEAPKLGLPALSYVQLQFINSNIEIDPLMVALGEKEPQNASAMTPSEYSRYSAKRGRCSGLVKVTPGLDNIFVSHTTWDGYSNMLRFYRFLDLQLRNPAVNSRRIAYSSYPATVTSNDDFLVAPDTQMVLLETTNDVFDQQVLRDHASPQILLNFAPVLVATWLAKSGEDWHKYFAAHNDGFYSNQWMAVDMKRFVRGAPLQDGLLTISEIIPGSFVWQDVTTSLGLGEWPSYNVPYFPEIYKKSGYPAVAKAKPHATWTMAPRAQIFRRDAGGAVDLASVQRFMRYNDFRNDPLSANDPGAAIMARLDLYPEVEHRIPDGANDNKIIDYAMMVEGGGEALIRNGPTSDQQPVFSWSEFERATGKTYKHEGLPDRYDFPWVRAGFRKERELFV